MIQSCSVLAVTALSLTSIGGSSSAQTPTVTERFNTPWAPTTNPSSYGEATDRLFKIDGTYCVGYGGAHANEFNGSNVAFTADANGPRIDLIVRAGTHTGIACGVAYGASEIATDAGWLPVAVPPFGVSTYGYGYYETRMRPACVQGEISSFFWIQAPHYGPLEIDVEFPNPPGHTFNDVHWTLHPSGRSVDYQLGFNPCLAFHRYGFLWTPGKVVFTVDGAARQTFDDGAMNSTQTGFIMANAWTGLAAWGGGPPSQDAVNSYRWIKFTANATTIQPH